jgi:hypothetical protein
MTCVFTWRADTVSVESVLTAIYITYIDYVQEQYIYMTPRYNKTHGTKIYLFLMFYNVI